MTDRAAFEKWLRDFYYMPRNEPVWDKARHCYQEFPVHLAWKAWQAALAVKTSAPEVGGVTSGKSEENRVPSGVEPL